MDEVLTASPHRVVPKCEFFGLCGGCALQHLNGAEQVAAKQTTLLDNLARIGKVEPERVLGAITGPTWRYRRRARLGVKDVTKKGRVLVGFRERFKPYIANMTHCEVLADPVGTMIEALSDLIGSFSIKNRLPQIEVTVADNVTALVFRVLEPPNENDLKLLSEFERENGLVVYLQPGGLDTIAPLSPPAPALHYDLQRFGVRITFEPTDFIQVNRSVNEAMVAQAIDLLQLSGTDTVLDLFSGLGNFTLPIAKIVSRVTAVEGDHGLVARARKNATSNSIDNAEFHVANLFEADWHPDWAKQRYDKLLIDPPRAGAAEIVEHVSVFGAKRIVYVSCHPGSLARDAKTLVHEFGYTLEAAGVMDMFPHTSHVESIAAFRID